MKGKIFLLLAPVLLLAGCLNKDISESGIVLKADVSEIRVPGEFDPETGDNKVFVNVTANRSWFAHLNYRTSPVGPDEAVDYAVLLQSEGCVFNGASKGMQLGIAFGQNTTNKERTGVLDFYCEGEKRLSIPIVQEGIIYRLDAHADRSAVGEAGGTALIAIDCNTEWQAAAGRDSQVDITLDKSSGWGTDTIKVTFPESNVMEQLAASVVISAADCEDVKIAFTQDACTKKPFSPIKLGFTSAGSGEGIVPVLVLDKEAMGTQIFKDGATFHYTMGATGFGDLAEPTSGDPQIGDSGISLLPEGYHTNKDATKVFTGIYLKIAGFADGYKDTHLQVLVRNWSFGQKYVYNQTSPVNGLSISGAAGGKQTFYIRFAESGKNTMTASVHASMTGTAKALMKYHTGTQKTTVEFKAGDNVILSQYSTGINATAPELLSTPEFELTEGQTVSLSNLGPSGYSYLWSFLLMEESKY